MYFKMKMEINSYLIKMVKKKKLKLQKMESHFIEMKRVIYKWCMLKINLKLIKMITEINL